VSETIPKYLLVAGRLQDKKFRCSTFWAVRSPTNRKGCISTKMNCTFLL